MPSKDADKSNFKTDFFKITQLLPVNTTNRVGDNCIQKDAVFDLLGEKVFDNPRLLDLLFLKLRRWIKEEKGEFIFALAGYLYYYAEKYNIAEGYLIRYLNANPKNLDIWFRLAFSLYHQGRRKHLLGKKILYNFDSCIYNFKDKKITVKKLEEFLRHAQV